MANGKDGVDKIVALFRLYEKNMYHIAYAILHDSYQAEDAVMEAFVRLMERNYAIDDPSSDEAKRLVIQVIRSTAIDQYRKNQRESERQVLVEDFAALETHLLVFDDVGITRADLGSHTPSEAFRQGGKLFFVVGPDMVAPAAF